MSSPSKIKRSHPEIVTLESVKLWKDGPLKENIPPTASMESQPILNRLLIDKQCQATPKKRALNEEPVTPNANFKLLTSLAAAQEYASAPKKTADYEACSYDTLVLFDNKTCDDSEIICNPTSRKEKSLSIICTRFLDMYPLYPNLSKETIVVSLDEVSTKLAIERRRLYDIVNVFESIEMLCKLAKNRYMWYGKNYLMHALQKLKKGAIKECMLEKLQYVLDFEDSLPDSKPSCILTEVRYFNQSYEYSKKTSSTPEVLKHASPVPELRKEKSLALMSQKFLMLFLVSPAKIISLGVAAKVLNGFQISDKGAQVKTQIRRLYDIANVLSSIGLIQKEVTIGQNGRKPAFKYIGPDVDAAPGTPTREIPKHKASSVPPKMKPKSLVRHSSFQEICAVAEMERNKIYELDELPNSAPPFQKNFRSEDTTTNKTSFSNLKLDLKTDLKPVSPISSHLKDLKNLPLLQKTKSVNLDAEKKRTQVPLRSISLPRQSSVKLINVPKQILSANGPYYIVNPATNEVKKSPTPMGTVLLISPLSINNSAKEVVQEKIPEKKATGTRTLQLSAEQRDTILKSLNLSLSDGQIAAIQLEGSSASQGPDVKPRCNLLKIIEKHELSADAKPNPKQVNKLEPDSSESSRCSTRNASPMSCSSRISSPLSLCGSVTAELQIRSENASPAASNSGRNVENGRNVLNGNIGFRPILVEDKKGRDVSSENSLKGFRVNGAQFEEMEPSVRSSVFQHQFVGKLTNNLSRFQYLNRGEKRKNEEPLKEIINLSPSASSDSLNAEVSEILNEKNAKNALLRNKSFLIEDVTLLSPIKKQKLPVSSKPLTPTYFTTPPYTAHDTYFEFNNLPPKQINGKALSFNLSQEKAKDDYKNGK